MPVQSIIKQSYRNKLYFDIFQERPSSYPHANKFYTSYIFLIQVVLTSSRYKAARRNERNDSAEFIILCFLLEFCMAYSKTIQPLFIKHFIMVCSLLSCLYSSVFFYSHSVQSLKLAVHAACKVKKQTEIYWSEFVNVNVWTGFTCLGIGSGGGLLWTRSRTFRIHTGRVISWLAKRLLISQKELFIVELIITYAKIAVHAEQKSIMSWNDK